MEVDGVMHKMDTLADSLKDLKVPLKRFGAYLKKKAKAKYEAQNFAPLAQATLEARAQKGLHRLERKLTYDLEKAIKRGQPERLPKGMLAKALAAIGADVETAPNVGPVTRGQRNRMAVLAEFHRRHSRGDSTLMAAAAGKELSLKQIASLDAREGRAVAKAVNKKILGRLPDTLVATVDVGAATVTLASRTSQEWSAAHNEGAVAGHGAKIPKRETIALDEHDLQVFAEILKDQMLLAVSDA